MNKTKISVIIPIYKVEPYIEKCARSLFAQTLKNGIEYIFVDDCSPDRSIEILENTLEESPERKNQVKIIRHTKNQGVGKSRLDGLESATGEYIIHCDPDDWVEQEMYEKMLQKAEEDKADIVICDYIEENEFENKVIKVNASGNQTEILSKIIKGDIHNGLCNKLINRDLYLNYSITFQEGQNFWEDTSVVPRLFYVAKKISYLPQAFYNYYKNPQSYTNTIWKPEFSENIIQALITNHNFFKEKHYDDTPLLLRGFFLILLKEKKSQREKYRINFQILPQSKINYKLFKSNFRKVLGWCLFNGYDFFANCLITLHFLLKKQKL